MGNILKPAIVLLIFTVLSGLGIGYAYNITEPSIKQQEIDKKIASRKELLPEADSFEEQDIIGESSVVTVVIAYKNKELDGYLIGSSVRGYSGPVESLVAISPDGEILGVKLVKQTETPGLGTNAEKPDFINQYKGKSSGGFTVVKNQPKDNEIQAVTSATITSTAVTNGVNAAMEYFETNFK